MRNLKDILRPMAVPLTKRYYGNQRDGGYVLFSELVNRGGGVLSYGIGDNVDFDLAMAEAGLRVYMFDHTINQLPTNHAHFTFFKLPFSKGFTEHLQMCGLDDRTDITGKIDVEGEEWNAFRECPLAPIVAHFAQLVIEFHHVRFDDADQYNIFQRLLIGYYIGHIHGNNYGTVSPDGMPETLEITLVRKDLVKCPVLLVGAERRMYPIEGLDHPNNPERRDLPLNWWL